MRMPFNEFIANGDLKFIIAFLVLSAIAIFHLIKKVQVRKNPDDLQIEKQHISKFNTAIFWILLLSILSLLLGFMHGFYFIGKAGGMAPYLIFQGVSYALITPIIGVLLFAICKILYGISILKGIN